MLKKCAMLAALATLLAPGAASADWLFTPNVGAGFGGSASGREHLTYGASIGWMGAGVFGWEADFAYTPEFFEADDDDIDLIENSNFSTFMVNAIIGAPAGGSSRPSRSALFRKFTFSMMKQSSRAGSPRSIRVRSATQACFWVATLSEMRSSPVLVGT